jgi:cysteine desulfuration protein SufE
VSELPPKLQSTMDLLAMFPDRTERIQALLSMADRYQQVPASVAERPYPEEKKAPACESEAYVWVQSDENGKMQLHFAVENPQGMSARVMAVILKDGLSGRDPAEAAGVPEDLVYEIFGRELSMGKSAGLMGMIQQVKVQAARAARSAS